MSSLADTQALSQNMTINCETGRFFIVFDHLEEIYGFAFQFLNSTSTITIRTEQCTAAREEAMAAGLVGETRSR